MGTCPQMTRMDADGVRGGFDFIRVIGVIRGLPGLRGGGDWVRAARRGAHERTLPSFADETPLLATASLAWADFSPPAHQPRRGPGL